MGGHAVEKLGVEELGRSLERHWEGTRGQCWKEFLWAEPSREGHPRLMGWTWGLFRGNRILTRFSKGKS